MEASISQGLLNGNKINCMAFGCNATITEEFMMSFVSDKFNEMFLKTKIDLFVANNHRLRWCVTPNCEGCIKKLCDENLYYVHCDCDAEFCFHCGEEPHFPGLYFYKILSLTLINIIIHLFVTIIIVICLIV